MGPIDNKSALVQVMTWQQAITSDNDNQFYYRKTSSISRTKWQNLNSFLSPFAVVFAQSIEARC